MHTFCQLARFFWHQWLGFFCPMLGGALCRPGSSEAASVESPGLEISYPGVAGNGPCPGNGVLVAQSSCSLLWRCGISLLVPERTPVPYWQIPRCHLAWELLGSSCHQAGMSNCCACQQINSAVLWGEAQVLRSAGGHPPFHCSPKGHLLLIETLGWEGQGQAGTQGPPLVWLLV